MSNFIKKSELVWKIEGVYQIYINLYVKKLINKLN